MQLFNSFVPSLRIGPGEIDLDSILSFIIDTVFDEI